MLAWKIVHENHFSRQQQQNASCERNVSYRFRGDGKRFRLALLQNDFLVAFMKLQEVKHIIEHVVRLRSRWNVGYVANRPFK